MANNKRTIYLGLDYSNFTGGVTEVNRKMALLDSEFKLAQQEAKNYGNETDALGTKHDYLTQKIALQNQKVEAAKKAYEEAAASENASQKQLDALQKTVINETTSLEKMKGQLKETDEAQEKLNKTSKSFGDTIRGLASDLGLSVSPAIEKLASKFDGVSAAAGTAVLVIGGIVTALTKMSIEASKTADDLLTMASVTGFSVEELQKLKYASEFVDVSVDTMSSAITKLTSNMDKSKDKTSDIHQAFVKLRVSTTDMYGNLKDANEVFYSVIDGLGRISNETERDALAMTIFGKSAKELNPLIEAGSKRLRELGIEAEGVGYIMGDTDVEKLGKLNDAIEKSSKAFDGMKNDLSLLLLPVLTDVFTAITNLIQKVNNMTPATKGMIVALTSAVATFMVISTTVKTFSTVMTTMTAVQTAFQAVSLKTTLIILGVVAALVALAAIIAVIVGKKNDLNQVMTETGKVMQGIGGSFSSDGTYKTGRNASGTNNFRGGQTWVGEEGPELVTLPGGSQITPASQIGSTEYNTFNVTIDAKSVSDFNRVVELCMAQKSALRRV